MAVFLKTATPTFLLKAIFCYCQKSLYQFHFLTLSGIVIENTNFCKLHIWLVVVVSLRFYQKKAMRWTMRLQRYFKKENFCGRNLKKKNSKYSLRHLISLPRKERGKEGSSLSQASGCGCASWVVPAFGHSLDFETTFENMEEARLFAFLMFQKKVVAWCSQHLLQHNDHRFVITVVIIVVKSLADIWKERMCSCC